MKRLCLHAAVLGYLVITAAGFLHTMTGLKVPFLPWKLVEFSYGMMAPYQGYVTYEQGLLAEGLGANGWEIIDHRAYFPYLRGERVLREWMMAYRKQENDVLLGEKYRELARQIQKAEARAGRTYERLRLSWERWPISPVGHEDLHHDPFVTRELLVTYP